MQREAVSLRLKLSEECAKHGESMSSLTVLAGCNDPYRFDTPARHRDAQWLVEQIKRLKVVRPVHLRGLHYIIASAADAIRPNGELYINDEQCWTWLESTAAKAARWLGYLDWHDIKDERNEKPELVLAAPRSWPAASISFDFCVELPYSMAPEVYVSNFDGRQKYQLLLFGEKSSLKDVLAPIASRYGASLALPTGETSNTMVADIARHAASDGRPMVIFYFSDADPAGWQMPISVARKLQALRDQQFPDLAVQVQPVALRPDQVKEYGLPSTPLKASGDPTGGKLSSELSKPRLTLSPRSNPDYCGAWPTRPSLHSSMRHCGPDAAAPVRNTRLWPRALSPMPHRIT